MAATIDDWHATRMWLERMYVGHEIDDGWLTLFAVNAQADRHVRWARTPAQLTQAAAELAPTCDVWFGVAPRRRNTGKRRGGAANCLGVPTLWVDLDVVGDTHRQDGRLFNGAAEATTFARSFPLPPTTLVWSGHGVQAWWSLTGLAAAADAVVLLERWGATWSRRAREVGRDLDNVWDLARVMRVPGTVNRKGGGAAEVGIIEEHWERRYGLDDLDEVLDEAAPAPEPNRGRSVPYIGPERPGDAFNAQRRGGDILAAQGWTLAGRDHNGDERWLHPWGPSNDTSAVVYADDGHTTVYSDTAPKHHPAVRVRRPYDPFGLLTVLAYDGDHQRSSDALAAQGYGSKPVRDDAFAWLAEGISAPTGEEPWEEPDTFEAPETPPFPVHVLPAWMSDHVTAVADRLQVPIDLTAQLAIGALAAVTVGRVDVSITLDWSEPLGLYLVTAMASGAGKSPADKAMLGPLRRLEADLIEEAAEEVQRAEVERRKLEAKVRSAERKAARSDSDDEVWQALDALTQADEKVPPRLLVGDATPEVLAHLLDRHGGRLAIVSTESALFDVVCGVYGPKVNLNVYLQGWSGDDLIVDRKGGSGSPPTQLRVPAIHLTVAVTVQPSVLSELRHRPELAGRGFTARFMYALPSDLRGRRDRRKVLANGAIATAPTYAAEFRRLAWRITHWETVATVTMEHAAAHLFVEWMQALEERIGPAGDLRDLSEWTAKLIGSVARLAGLLHMAHGGGAGPSDPLRASTLQKALDVGQYWIAHAKAVHDLWGSSDETVMARKVLAWTTEQGESFTRRDALRRFCSQFPTVEELDPILELLVKRHLIRRVGGGTSGPKGGRPTSPRFQVNPALLRPNGELSTGSVGSVGFVSLGWSRQPSLSPHYPHISTTH